MAKDHGKLAARKSEILALETRKAKLTAQLLVAEKAEKKAKEEAEEKAIKEANEKMQKEIQEKAAEKARKEVAEKGVKRGATFFIKKGVGFVVKKNPIVGVGMFTFTWSQEGFGGAVNDAVWPLSEFWDK